MQERYGVFDGAMSRFNQHLGSIYRYPRDPSAEHCRLCGRVVAHINQLGNSRGGMLTNRSHFPQAADGAAGRPTRQLLQRPSNVLSGCKNLAERFWIFRRQLTAKQGDAYVSYCKDPTLCFVSGTTLHIR